jgi:signal transduction histidine kinase/PAS domain-containing protein
MKYTFTLYSFIYLFTSFLSLGLALTARTKWSKPGAKSIFWMMLAIFQWTLSGSLEMSAVSMAEKLFWSQVEYIGTLSAPVFLLLFALEYNQLTKVLIPRNIILLFIIPILSLLFAFTNQWHHLIWAEIYPSPIGMNLAVYKHGTAFWFMVIGYSYLLIFISFLLMIWALIRLPRIYKMQTISLLLACLIPWVGNFLYVTELSPFPGLELTALSMAFTGLICTLAIYRFKFLKLVPIARDALIEIIPEGVVILDNHFALLDANPAARRTLNISHAQNPSEFISFLEAHSDINEWLRQGKESIMEIPMGVNTYQWSIKPFFDLNESPFGYLLVIRDITEDKILRDNLQYSERFSQLLLKFSSEFAAVPPEKMDEALNKTIEQLGLFIGVDFCCLALFSPSGDVMTRKYVWDIQGRKILQGLSLEEQPVSCPMVLPRLINPGQIIYQKSSSITELSEEDINNIFPSSLLPIESAIFVPLLDGNHLKGALYLANHTQKKDWTSQDVSLYREAARLFSQVLSEKEHQQEQLEMERQMLQLQKLESLGVLAGGIAHDFNNRFTAILGNIDMARELLPNDSKAQEFLADAANVVHTSAEKTRHILAYSGKAWYDFDNVNINQLINNSIPLFQSAIGRHIILKLVLAPEIPAMYADGEQIRQMMLNLLSNASEAIGKNQGQILIATVLNHNQIVLSVKDTGCGMDEETRKKLFEPFFTTKFIGRGLGMSAVLGIVRAHHGSIQVESQPGQGTTISISFPSVENIAIKNPITL